MKPAERVCADAASAILVTYPILDIEFSGPLCKDVGPKIAVRYLVGLIKLTWQFQLHDATLVWLVTYLKSWYF